MHAGTIPPIPVFSQHGCADHYDRTARVGLQNAHAPDRAEATSSGLQHELKTSATPFHILRRSCQLLFSPLHTCHTYLILGGNGVNGPSQQHAHCQHHHRCPHRARNALAILSAPATGGLSHLPCCWRRLGTTGRCNGYVRLSMIQRTLNSAHYTKSMLWELEGYRVSSCVDVG